MAAERLAEGASSPNHSVRSSISMHTTARGRELRADSSGQAAAAAVPATFDEEQDGHEDGDNVMSRSISVGREEGLNGAAWDESDEEEQEEGENEEGGEEGHTDSEDEGAPLALSSGGLQQRRRVIRPVGARMGDDEEEGQQQIAGRGRADSYLQTLKPSSTRTKRYWKWLTHSSPAHASLSAPHVSANLFAASLHPAVLLSMPYYFERTGLAAGVGGLVVVAILGGAGGGLWVVLSRYVKGSTVEAITGASFGRHTKWKGNLGRAFSGVLLAVYATGAAVIAYFALADLLLQVLFHYFPSGYALHDRALVTLLIGGLLTTPLVVFPLAKRTLIRLSTFLAVLLYPIILAIVLSKVYTLPPDESHAPHDPNAPDPHDETPSFNPLHDPSVWAPFSLLPLLTLSSSPLQILAHNRSLRRRGLSGSNVKAFLAAQAAQVFFVVGLSVAFGIGVGTQGIKDRMGVDIHPNLFASLPRDDHLINLARGGFVAILSSHLALCLVTARSSWGRLLRLFRLNPLRKRRAPLGETDAAIATSHSYGSVESQTAGRVGRIGTTGAIRASLRKPPRAWGKLARNALGGLILWGLTSSTAYFSGVGGLRRREKQGEEARFVHGSEVLGLLGAAVGFVTPALVWIIIFMLRQPRAILPLAAASQWSKSASAWFMGPLGALARTRRRAQPQQQQDERQPLLDGASSDERFRASLNTAGPVAPADQVPQDQTRQTPTWQNERAAPLSSDEATRILLARKEDQLQRRTRNRRLYQDILVVFGILPLGIALIVLGTMDLAHGGW